MLDSIAFANAATIVTIVFYAVFVVFAYIFPDLIYSISKSWLHSMNLDSTKAQKAISVEKAFIGLITISAITWITTYAMIWLYNLLSVK